MPALGLFFQRLPADEDVERGFAFEYRSQLILQRAGSSETFGGSRLVGFGVFRLLLNPIAEIAIGELLQIGMIESMIVNESVKPIGPPVPQVPDKRSVLKELACCSKNSSLSQSSRVLGFTALKTGASNKRSFVERSERGG